MACLGSKAIIKEFKGDWVSEGEIRLSLVTEELVAFERLEKQFLQGRTVLVTVRPVDNEIFCKLHSEEKRDGNF